MDLGSRYLGPFGKHLSLRGVVDNFKVTSYNVASRIIYEWGTCTGAIRRLRFEIVNIEITQHMFVINFFLRYWSGINIRNYRHRLILNIWVEF
jgi:hypothetical protein